MLQSPDPQSSLFNLRRSLKSSSVQNFWDGKHEIGTQVSLHARMCACMYDVVTSVFSASFYPVWWHLGPVYTMAVFQRLHFRRTPICLHNGEAIVFKCLHDHRHNHSNPQIWRRDDGELWQKRVQNQPSTT